MKNNADNPLWSPMEGRLADKNIGVEFYHNGLTKREYFAGLAMQALMPDEELSITQVCKLSVVAADQLLKELEKTQSNDTV